MYHLIKNAFHLTEVESNHDNLYKIGDKERWDRASKYFNSMVDAF